jgi:DNA-binding transcriptional regulator/RsmH inhibitor MraZ
MDPQGRVTLPSELRREFSLENQEVRVECSTGAINVYSMAEYAARAERYRENLESKLNAAKKKGFK